jgi:hypothetical protein
VALEPEAEANREVGVGAAARLAGLRREDAAVADAGRIVVVALGVEAGALHTAAVATATATAVQVIVVGVARRQEELGPRLLMVPSEVNWTAEHQLGSITQLDEFELTSPRETGEVKIHACFWYESMTASLRPYRKYSSKGALTALPDKRN